VPATSVGLPRLFLLRPSRHVVHAMKQSILLRCQWLVGSTNKAGRTSRWADKAGRQAGLNYASSSTPKMCVATDIYIRYTIGSTYH
jgi:hypothetical protein